MLPFGKQSISSIQYVSEKVSSWLWRRICFTFLKDETINKQWIVTGHRWYLCFICSWYFTNNLFVHWMCFYYLPECAAGFLAKLLLNDDVDVTTISTNWNMYLRYCLVSVILLVGSLICYVIMPTARLCVTWQCSIFKFIVLVVWPATTQFLIDIHCSHWHH